MQGWAVEVLAMAASAVSQVGCPRGLRKFLSYPTAPRNDQPSISNPIAAI